MNEELQAQHLGGAGAGFDLAVHDVDVQVYLQEHATEIQEELRTWLSTEGAASSGPPNLANRHGGKGGIVRYCISILCWIPGESSSCAGR